MRKVKQYKFGKRLTAPWNDEPRNYDPARVEIQVERLTRQVSFGINDWRRTVRAGSQSFRGGYFSTNYASLSVDFACWTARMKVYRVIECQDANPPECRCVKVASGEMPSVFCDFHGMKSTRDFPSTKLEIEEMG